MRHPYHLEKLIKSEDPSFFAAAFIYIALILNAFFAPIYVTAFSVLYIFVYLMTTRFTIPGELAGYAVIPLALILIGMMNSAGHDIYDVLKDGWYFINPAIIFTAGFLAFTRIRKLEPLLRIFIVTGTLLSLIYLGSVLSDMKFLLNASVDELHRRKPGNYLLSVISLSLVLFASKFDMQVFKKKQGRGSLAALIIINAAAVLLSFYRTWWLSFAILYTFGSGMFHRRKFRWVLVMGIIVVIFQAVVLFAPKEMLTTYTMLGKIARSLDEIVVTDYYTKTDMQMHWRGYESYMAIQTYLDGNALNLIAGHGLGKLVDLKMTMLIAGEKTRYIPILHNGYMYLLVKTGVIGILLYLAYFRQFIRRGLFYSRMNDAHLLFAGQNIVGISVVLLVATFVTGGVFNKLVFYPWLLFLGCLISYGRIRSNELENERARSGV